MSEWDTFWLFFGRFDNVLGVATTFFSGYAAYKLRRESERRRRELLQSSYFGKGQASFQEVIEESRGIKTPKPVALAVSLIHDTRTIRHDVKLFLEKQGWDMPIEEIEMNGLNGQEDLERYVALLREMRYKLSERGATELHLFFSGPVQAATVLGAIYRN